MEDEVITPEVFDSNLKELLGKTEDVLGMKANEYATTSNRYHNFAICRTFAETVNASAVPFTIPQMIWFLCLKHITSCVDIIKGIVLGRRFKRAFIDEKFGDFVNYLFLLWIYIRTKHSIEEDAD